MGITAIAHLHKNSKAQLISMGDEMVANTHDLMYLFFTIEFKSDSLEGSGSLWAATNQCLRGSVSGVNIAERLNRQRMQCKNKEVRLIIVLYSVLL